MKRIVPSTRGGLTIVLNRNGAQQVSGAYPTVRFGSIRERLNSLLGEWDTADNPVTTATIAFTTTGNRSRHV